MIAELEFGDSHIPHSWESWAKTKLKKPDSFRTERVLDKMPNFHLAPDEIEALVVLLKGFNGSKIPVKYRKTLSEKETNLVNFLLFHFGKLFCYFLMVLSQLKNF